MATTRRVKTPAASIYSSEGEADTAIARIGTLQRERTNIASVTEEQISRLTEEASIAIKPIEAEIKQLVVNLSLYGEYNRKTLTNNERTKTVKFAHGTLKWRFTPLAVTIKGVDDVLARLKKLKLTQFIRTKETINKEAMGSERELAESIEGVTFGRREEFVITPSETNLDIPVAIKTTKKKEGSASD